MAFREMLDSPPYDQHQFGPRRISLDDDPWSPAPMDPKLVGSLTPITPQSGTLPRNFSRRNPSASSSRIFRSASNKRGPGSLRKPGSKGAYHAVHHLGALPPPPPKPWAEARRFRSPRAALGSWGLAVMLGGTLTSLAVLAFLWYLWKGTGTAVWRWVVLSGFLAQAVTLSAAVLRFVVSAQAVVGTGMLAALVLERHGVPLVHVAELSVMRAAKGGPARLASLLLGSTSFLRTAKFPILLTLNLLLGAFAAQFFSTMLFIDLDIGMLVGDEESVLVATDLGAAGGRLEQVPALSYPPAFTPFGEETGPSSLTLDNGRGVSDTGVVQRAFLTMDDGNRTNLRSYLGKGYVHTSRFVCVRPTVTGAVQMGNGSTPESALIPQFAGKIDLPATWDQTGVHFPNNCSSFSCLAGADNFTCNLPVQSTDQPALPSLTLCYPRRSNFFIDPGRDIGNESVSRFSEVVLVLRSDFTSGRVNTLVQQNMTSFPNQTQSQDEFTTWQFGGVSLSMSMCFAQQTVDFADVRLSAHHDLSTPATTWDDTKAQWNLHDVAMLYGVANTSGASFEERGIYTVRYMGNLTKTPLTTFLISSPLLLSHSQVTPPDNQSLAIHLTPSSAVNTQDSLPIHPLLANLFLTTLNTTSRPSLALQSLASALASTALRATLPRLTTLGPAITTTLTPHLLPTTARGLFAVAATVLSHVLCVAGIAVLYLARTRHSSLGDAWRAVAQVAGEETEGILEDAGEFDDAAVAEMLGPNGRLEVKVARTYGEGGGVGVVPVGGGVGAVVGRSAVGAPGRGLGMSDTVKRRSVVSSGGGL